MYIYIHTFIYIYTNTYLYIYISLQGEWNKGMAIVTNSQKSLTAKGSVQKET